MNQFELGVRVYYEDTDAGGVVYHSNYLNFMERARTEWLRELGYQQTTLIQQRNIIFVVRSIQIDYLKPAVFNDLLTVRCSIAEYGRTSIHFRQDIFRQGQAEPLVSAIVRVVCVSADAFRPTAIPDDIRGQLCRADH